MGEPSVVHPSMRKADVWPLSPVETVLLAILAYLVLLISLVGARLSGPGEAPPQQAMIAALVANARPAFAEQAAQQMALASCVTARTVPQSYAEAAGVESPMAFGPPVEPAGPLSAAEINGELIHRLCGGVSTPGGRYHGPDRRLYVAIDAAVNGRDPNRSISRAEWAAGVDRFITRDAQWLRAKVVTRRTPRGTQTFGMRPRPGADPLVVRTRLATTTSGRFLVLPVRTAGGSVVPVTLRLLCGFQPVF